MSSSPDDAKTETVPVERDAVAAMRERRGRERPICLVVYHPDGASVVPLAPGVGVVLGRSDPADVAIADRSLSRVHARFTLSGGAVLLEDLGSTNGCSVGDARVERCELGLGDEALLGAVSVVVHSPAGDDTLPLGLAGHDRFLTALEDEVSRARYFGRGFAVLLVSAQEPAPPLSRWCPYLRTTLRPIDRMARYGGDCVEILVPEADLEHALAAAAAITARRTGAPAAALRCGVGVYPGAGTTAEQLIAVTLAAMRRANGGRPVECAPADGWSTEAPSDEGGPVAASPTMAAIFETVTRLARTVIPILLLGETGVGKEVVARAIHEGGARRNRPLISVNCGAIPAQLIESTLFGHEKGAFTGASRQEKGVFEAAHGGTVLLDEVGELPGPAQAALLRVLESKRLTRVGSSREIEVDVRVISATHRDLEAMCEKGTFRADLRYRLEAMTVTIPPLRARPEDILPLARRFLGEACRANGCDVRSIDPAALALLEAHAWPGNARELRNAIERAVVVARGPTIVAEDLPERVRAGVPRAALEAAPPDSSGAATSTERGLRGELARYETELLVRALDESGWNQTEAAKRLEMPLRTLVHRIKTLGLKKRAT